MLTLDADKKRIVTDAVLASFARWKQRTDPSGRMRATLLGGEPPTSEDLQPLEDTIRALDQFRAIDGWFAWTKGQQIPITATVVTNWIFPKYSDERDAPEAAEKLDRLLSTRTAPMSYMTAVWGARVAGQLDLGNGIVLHPFNTLHFAAADDFRTTSFGGPAQFLGAYRAAVDGPPETILVVRCEAFPFLSGDSAAQARSTDELREKSETACLSLLVFGTRHPIIDISWQEYETAELNFLVYEKRRFWRMPEVIPLSVNQYDVDAEALTNSHQQLQRLEASRRERYVRAIKRFELSLARHDIGNAVIDLCIAFEQCMGERKDTPISWTHGLRTALLLSNAPEERRQIRDTIETLYKMRNAFVHGGSIDEQVTTKTRGRMATRNLLEDARQLYCRITKALIAVERDPDWSELETNGRA